jgi:hypothetical protein
MVPFSAAFHVIYPRLEDSALDADDLHMESELYFRGPAESATGFAVAVDSLLASYLADGVTIVGHQLASDLHTLSRSSSTRLVAVEAMIEMLRRRREERHERGPRVADTRYDISGRQIGNGAEKLRNVSLRYRVIAVQNELEKISLTKLYNRYVLSRDNETREILTTVNWRHAFQTSLVWLSDLLRGKPVRNRRFDWGVLVTNDIMWEMGHEHLGYLDSPEFVKSRTRGGVLDYISKYSPALISDAASTGRRTLDCDLGHATVRGLSSGAGRNNP